MGPDTKLLFFVGGLLPESGTKGMRESGSSEEINLRGTRGRFTPGYCRGSSSIGLRKSGSAQQKRITAFLIK